MTIVELGRIKLNKREVQSVQRAAKEKGLRIATIARQTKVSEATIASLINGNRNTINQETLFALSDCLGIEVPGRLFDKRRQSWIVVDDQVRTQIEKSEGSPTVLAKGKQDLRMRLYRLRSRRAGKFYASVSDLDLLCDGFSPSA